MRDLTMLETIVESENVQNFLAEESTVQLVQEGEDALLNFTQVIKDEILANPARFIGETLQDTITNMTVFTEGAICAYADQLTDQMVEATA